MATGMTSVRRAAASVAMCAVIAAGASAQEAFRLQHAPEVGHEHVYDVEASVRLEQRLGDGDPQTTDIRQRARVRLRATSVHPNGGATIALEVAQLSQAFDSGEGPMLFEWPKLTTEITPDTDRHRAFARVCGAVAGVAATLTVDADGFITGVEGLETIVAALGEQSEFDQSIVGVFSARQLAATLQPVFNADRRGGSAPQRRAGEGWQNIETVPLGDAGAFQIITEMRVVSANADRAVLAGTPTFEILRPADADATSARVRIASQSGSVSVVWDAQRGALERRAATQEIGTVWTLGGLELTQQQRAETTISRVE